MASNMNNNNNDNPIVQQKKKRRVNGNDKKTGLDVWLQNEGKKINVGERICLKLVKGPATTTTVDPVDKKAPKETFPLIMKFGNVTIPNFNKQPWIDGRLYQQDVPKPTEDSDEEQDNDAMEKKRRWRYNRNQNQQPRQWILQEQVDFLETMIQRREKKLSNKEQAKAVSTRYEGLQEHNPSQYVLLSLSKQQQQVISVRNLPTPQSVIAFQQPASRRTLTLSEAEQAIQDQRMGLKSNILRVDRNAKTASTDTTQQQQQQPNLLARLRKKNDTKNRLLEKLKKKSKDNNDDDIEEADDVMGDVAFRTRKGSGGGMARKELFSTLGDGIAVSDDGVLGGTNDAVFAGRRQRFGNFQATADNKKVGGGEKTERGADGAAMEEDFYVRDVKAEYEELDYDANEQFDDDDVDLGEGEVQDVGGFGGANDDDDDDDDDLDDDNDDDTIEGAEGLATVAGFKLLLAKARGEVTAEPQDDTTQQNGQQQQQQTTQQQQQQQQQRKNENGSKRNEDDENDHMSKIIRAAAEAKNKSKMKHLPATTTTNDMDVNGGANNNNNNPMNANNNDDGTTSEEMANSGLSAINANAEEAAVQVDENGLRVISLNAVRREIWLNHGSIPINRLIKIFDAKKKHGADRQAKFREVVKELCTMRNDPINGRTLILKQHYSHMD